MFCEVALSADNRAKEHVLRNSWLKKLELSKHLISISLMRQHEKLKGRKLTADQLQTGEVCKRCNGGWMNHLDKKIEHIVLAYAADPLNASPIGKQEARDLTRWLLKVACVYEYTDEPHRRHIPRHVLHQVRRHNYLPRGVFAFFEICGDEEDDVNHVSVSSFDGWMLDWSKGVAALPQSKRMKFAIQYNKVIFGFVHVDAPGVVFTGAAGIHIPILVSQGALHMRMTMPDELNAFADSVPENVRAPINIVQLQANANIGPLPPELAVLTARTDVGA
jgi:hypothetical protein